MAKLGPLVIMIFTLCLEWYTCAFDLRTRLAHDSVEIPKLAEVLEKTTAPVQCYTFTTELCYRWLLPNNRLASLGILALAAHAFF